MGRFDFNREEKKRINDLISRITGFQDLYWYRKVIVKRIVDNKKRYKDVSDLLGVPLVLVPLIEIREMGPFVGRFSRYLGNGEKLNKITTKVPRGRGPFKNWEEGVVDALKIRGLNLIEKDDWSIERMLFELEAYNGWGYRNRGKESPYIWSMTLPHMNNTGLFIKDHVYDKNGRDKNIGVYAFYKLLCDADKDFILKTPKIKVVVEKSSMWNNFISIFFKKLAEIFSKLAKEYGSKRAE